jgi:GH43 family beta-xylosidase
MEPLPSEKQELANARYVWRKQCQADLIERFRDPGIKFDDAQWYFLRFKAAYEAELEAQEAASAERRK